MKPFTESDLQAFVYDEADMLDSKKFSDWLDLFAEDAYYWMPLSPGQTDAKLQTSLLYEDKLLLGIRVQRLSGARTFSEQPSSRCHHLMQQPRVLSADDEAGLYTVKTSFHYTETRRDAQNIYAGWVTHTLVRQGDKLRIRLKRVDLVNCDAAFGNISLFM